MKTLIFLTFVAVSTGAWAQFKIVTQESNDVTTTFAICTSHSSVVAVEETNAGSYRIRILINKQISISDDPYNQYNNMNVEFVFTGSNSEHHYSATTVGYIQNGYESTVWIVFEDPKLIEYFKKYNNMKVLTASTSIDTYSFSLSNFTNCLKQL